MNSIHDNSLTALAHRQYFTTAEAAEILRLKPNTLYKWSSKEGDNIRPVRIGNQLRWLKVDIACLLGTTAEKRLPQNI